MDEWHELYKIIGDNFSPVTLIAVVFYLSKRAAPFLKAAFHEYMTQQKEYVSVVGEMRVEIHNLNSQLKEMEQALWAIREYTDTKFRECHNWMTQHDKTTAEILFHQKKRRSDYLKEAAEESVNR